MRRLLFATLAAAALAAVSLPAVAQKKPVQVAAVFLTRAQLEKIAATFNYPPYMLCDPLGGNCVSIPGFGGGTWNGIAIGYPLNPSGTAVQVQGNFGTNGRDLPVAQDPAQPPFAVVAPVVTYQTTNGASPTPIAVATQVQLATTAPAGLSLHVLNAGEEAGSAQVTPSWQLFCGTTWANASNNPMTPGPVTGPTSANAWGTLTGGLSVGGPGPNSVSDVLAPCAYPNNIWVQVAGGTVSAIPFAVTVTY